LPDGGSFIFDIDLCNDVIPSESKTVINKANIEVKLKKVKTLQWGTLEYTGAALPSINPATAGTWAQLYIFKAYTTYMLYLLENIKHVYPSSSKKKKNWDQLAAQVEEEKLEGEQALNKVFQDIYSNGSEEQRRAMLKSFVRPDHYLYLCLLSDPSSFSRWSREERSCQPTGMMSRRQK
jgi:suppressor of G2 allele of SKP1